MQTRTHHLPPAQLLESACRHIVADHAADIPDLTRAVVLVPHLHAGQHVAHGLRRAAGVPVLLLPNILTLRVWADRVPLDRDIVSEVSREALLYQALSARRWFDHADLWAIAAELCELFDDLTRWHIGMPASLAEFQSLLERAYRSRAGATFAFEARLVHELWHALTRDQDRFDPETAYQLRLGRLAESNESAVYAIGLGRLAPSEQQFLQRCADRVPVVSFVEAFEYGPGRTAVEQVLAQAWPESSDVPLGDRAAQLRSNLATSALQGHLTFFGAHGIEQEARAIDLAVRGWLQQGCRSVAVVVLDRLVARRARALLERAQVLVRDEAGWAFSTTSAATVISRWFDACSNDFYYRDLLDLLKSPFAFADTPRSRRQSAVWRLEQLLRRESVRSDLDRFVAIASSSDESDVQDVLLAVQRAARLFERRRRKTLSDWLRALDAAMEAMRIDVGLDADAAGMQLRDLLQTFSADLATERLLLGFGEFRRWMGRRLESATFRDSGIESTVIFTSLASTPLRRFDAVLIAGADEAHLPGRNAPGVFFNQNVRRELGLPEHAQFVRDTEESLFSLIARTPQVCVTWQHDREGEPNLLSPSLERLRALHALAWKDRLEHPTLVAKLHFDANAWRSPAAFTPTMRPAPSISPEELPNSISASAYNALMACPYQFFANQVLRLRELDEVPEGLEKQDYGDLVHEILHRFHARCPLVTEVGGERAHAILQEVSRAVFGDAMAADYLARAWLMRWERLVPQYVDWQLAREAQGWRFHAGEVSRSVTITTPAGRHFELLGRLDRVDTGNDDSICVVDYKTTSAKVLADRLSAPGEDVQLPVYRLLWGGTVTDAMFVSLDREGIQTVEQTDDLGDLADAVYARLGQVLDRVSEGAPMPAQGSETACRYCRASGLCRRRYWS